MDNMYRLKDLPKIVTCKECDNKVSKKILDTKGLIWNKIICMKCRVKLEVKLKTKLIGNVTLGDFYMLKLKEFLGKHG